MKQMNSERMGTMSEGKLLFVMAVPVVISMMTQAFYNIVDSIYLGRVSEDCLTALSLAFPAQNLMIGLGTGTGVGVGALVSRALGAGNRERANRVAGISVFLMACCWAIMALFSIFGVKAFINRQTEVETIRNYAIDYLRIVTLGSLFAYCEMGFNRLLGATGLTRLAMWGQLVGSVSNIILDPFFIYGWCGLPAMGAVGAAVATVIGQVLGTITAIYLNLRYNHDLDWKHMSFRPNFKLIGEIYRIGLPSVLMVGISSIKTYLMNGILISFTSTAVAVFGSVHKLQSFAFLPIFGLNNAVVPILSYNYGACKRERVHKTLRYGIIFAMCFMIFIMSLFQLMPVTLLKIFSASDNMLALGVPAMRRISLAFITAGFCVVSCSACQALDLPSTSLIVTVARELAVLVPAAYLLSLSGNVEMIWWSVPISEAMSFIVSIFFVVIALRRADKTMSERLAAAAQV